MPTPYRLSQTQGRSVSKPRRTGAIRGLASLASDAVGTTVSVAVNTAVTTALYNPYSTRLRDLGTGLTGGDAHFGELVGWYERPARDLGSHLIELDEAC